MAASIHHGLTLPLHAVARVKGGWFGATHIYPSEMAQNFWTAIFAWSACFVMLVLGRRAAATAKPEESEHGSSKSGH